uniref:BTB domain-containing protein n=1 Tax=Globodera rostochiensis TaxID=31243 RepID=A0A914H2L4_GLORO
MPKPNSSLGRMEHMLSTGDDADVHFLVGGGEEKELLPAHKLILKAASDVFRAMFRFDAENAKSAAAGTVTDPVEVPDVEIGGVQDNAQLHLCGRFEWTGRGQCNRCALCG